jgi:hypothetical protein
MELTVNINVSEEKIDQALIEKIQSLEDEISYQTQQARKYENLCREIVKTQFPQYWFGNRKGMNITEVFEHLSKEKVVNE